MILERPRFSLRGLLVLVALASVLFALVAMHEPYRREQRLSRELESLGAAVRLVVDMPGRLVPFPADWFNFRAGHAFARVDAIDLVGTTVDDRVVDLLAGCTQVRFVDLSYSAINDEQFARLQSLGQLRVLNLSNTGVTDASIPALMAHETLVDLDITATRITAPAVKKLQAALPQLDIDH